MIQLNLFKELKPNQRLSDLIQCVIEKKEADIKMLEQAFDSAGHSKEMAEEYLSVFRKDLALYKQYSNDVFNGLADFCSKKIQGHVYWEDAA